MGTDSFLPSKIDKLENWDINEDEKKMKISTSPNL